MIVGPTVIMNPDYINLKQTSHLSDYPAFLRIDYTYIMYSSNDPYECLFLDLKNPERCSQNLALRRIPLARLYRPVASLGAGGHITPPLQFLADQLTLYQPGGQIMPTIVLCAPPPKIFRPPDSSALRVRCRRLSELLGLSKIM